MNEKYLIIFISFQIIYIMTTEPKKIVKWSKEEEKALLDEIQQGKTDEEISKLHHRSIGAIVIRRKKIALEMLNDDKSTDEILKLTRVSEEELNAQKKYESNKNKSGDQKLAVVKRKLEELIALL
jgi:uncharacterized protein YehS (DUF1456 family)